MRPRRPYPCNPPVLTALGGILSWGSYAWAASAHYTAWHPGLALAWGLWICIAWLWSWSTHRLLRVTQRLLRKDAAEPKSWSDPPR